MSANPFILLRTPYGWLASGFGSGLSPWAPGTAGSLAALLPAWLYLQVPFVSWWLTAVLLSMAFVAGCLVCERAGKDLGVHDHSALVWDEFVGQWLVLLVISPGVLTWGIAFIVFRLFDIWKPWPIKYIDQKVGGGFGVMLDDVLAALYALPVTYVVVNLITGAG